ncbi:ABC transporter ATP-binding protein [Desertimonas flava]|uniref:ABC transporter ATP-binding protein n=1 Tax=Desertimonas flava TaxID=2064846 RepID=UPI000E34528A|nr:ABC transporter ATP-binding protein [Desertimonas flava]
MADVLLTGISKSFGETSVLEELDLAIPDGEFVVIVGPSGCGKSTLLRIVAGIETPTSGSISIGGRDVGRVHPGQRDVAMVFQDYALYPHMTVAKNLSYGMRARREGTKAEIDARVRTVAESLQIANLLGRKPAQLSGGQRQRVALGRAMMRSPQVYLMDEPLSNLDAALRVQVREDLIQFHRDTSATVIYVTHDQVEAMTMGQRVIVMHDGVIQQSGPPDEIYSRPANQFVAAFVGSPRMNFVPATVSDDGNARVFTAGDLSWADRTAGDRAELPTDVVVGFRPESVHAGPGGDDSVTFQRVVDLVERLGHEAIVRLGDRNDRVLARVGPDAIPTPGTMTTWHVDRRSIHVFGPDGAALMHGTEREDRKLPATVVELGELDDIAPVAEVVGE